MLLQTTPEFRTYFLLEFTKELIKASRKKTILQTEKQNIVLSKKQFYQQSRFNIKPMPFNRNYPQNITPQLIPQKRIMSTQTRQIISQSQITNPTLPPRLQYIKPIPTDIEINLGKLNELLRDSLVLAVECDGPGKNIIVNLPSPKSTGVILTQEEIERIIKEFSDKAKIPIEQGIFKVAVGKLILLAAISELVSTKFIIKKIITPPQYPPQINTFSA